MTWIRDPRPGISWRLKRLRTKTRTQVKRLRAQLPDSVGGRTDLDAKTRFRVAWGRHWYDRPINDNLVLYESFGGNGALDNPRAIFDQLLEAQDLAHLKHVWCFANLTLKREFDKQFARHPRVRSVLTGTVEYYQLLSTAKYLVNNSTFPPNFVKRDEQVYLNTWHGTPLKKMGYDSPEGPLGAKNTIRNFLAADYLLSPNDYTTRVMYESGYRLRGIYQGTIVEEGYPRIDNQFLTESEKGDVRVELQAADVTITGEQIVLFAPTWRGRSFSDPLDDAEHLHAEVESLAAKLGSEYTVLLKVHQKVFGVISRHKALRNRLVPNAMPTNRLLGCVDVLVTDYSSIFFDFLATGRPILFYVPDAQGYERDRGVAIDLSELPGPTHVKIDDLAAGIKAISTGSQDDPVVTHGVTYREAVEAYCPKEDGKATSRIIDIVFRARHDCYRLRRGLSDDRISILVSGGRSRANGINTSLLSLLRNIDSSRYDVTIILHPPQDDLERELQDRIPSSVRKLIRTGTFPVTARRLDTHNRFVTTGLDPDGRFPGDEARVLAAEWSHTLGMSKFDHAIEFAGYAPFWPSVLLQGEVGTRSIWLHNDMVSDSRREVGGKRHLEESLLATFTLYQHFDNLVSVSPALARINAESLKRFAPPERFKSVHNTVDVERITSLGSGAATPGEAQAQDIQVAGKPLSTAAKQFVRAYPHHLVGDEIKRQVELARLLPDRGHATTFVTASRLSPEKNHARMIRAFAQVHAEQPDTCLLILGDGPLLNDLEALIDRLELWESVRLAGHRPNPYTLMAASDCFVLSSDYEGQPMVILEALTLGLPVVTVEFGSADSALPNSGGLVVPQSEDSLADGMRAFLRGEVSTREFHVGEYNAAALNEFLAAIGEVAGHGAEGVHAQAVNR